MSKTIEAGTTQMRRREITAWRELWKDRNRLVAVLGCMVAFATSMALMIPVISLTLEAADDVGVVQDVQIEERAFEDTAVVAGAADGDVRVVSADYQKVVHTLEAQSGAYRVSVGYTADAEVPQGAKLEVEEIASTSSEYEEYAAAAEEALGMEQGSASNIRLLDIKIVDVDDDKVEIAAPVDVKIELADGAELAADAQVVHFADEAETPDVVKGVEVDAARDAVSFEADGFSAYAIVEGPEPIQTNVETVADLQELAAASAPSNETAFYLSVLTSDKTDHYFKNTLNSNSAFLVSVGNALEADTWYFESAGSDSAYYIYTYVSGVKKYMHNKSGNLMELVATGGSIFEISEPSNPNGKFYFKIKDANKWLQWSNGGSGIRLWTDNNNALNSQITITYASSFDIPQDPYGLNGKSFGLMSWNDGASGKAMMAASTNAGTLDAKALTVMTHRDDNGDKLFVPADSDITMWTFEWVEGDRYYLKAAVDGGTKYLKLDGSGLSLADAADDACKIRVNPGTGAHAGEVCFQSADGTKTLTYLKSEEGGTDDMPSRFGTGGTTGSEWLKFVELSELTSDYFMTHTAKKISVSDPSITTGSKIIVYTRIWDDTDKRYKFYAINHDGSLLPCSENGDTIQWVGGQITEPLWSFVEYFEKDDNGQDVPSYYYELYSPYSDQYIAPQVTGGQVLSPNTIGINLNGRLYGRYYTTILAWDDDNYAYAGLKPDDQNKNVVSCPINEAVDFYFAVVQDTPVDDTLHTVKTVDSKKHGITMKMVDFNGETFKPSGADTTYEQHEVMGNSHYSTSTQFQPTQNLLSSDLKENGYPEAMLTNKSLYQLFSRASEVNHLFIESTYNATGYYEFDSTQNFASLGADGNFTIYKELGSYDSGGNKNTLKHGQFFPYNDIEPGVFATTNGRNLYTATAQPLSDDDPRKNEQLYLIRNVDPYFGMEIEASFVQTPNGLDAWGHDIIYEFTGDDDFWLYVDGELVIDLGGIHGALAGSVNFRTGQVVVNGVTKTLRQVFEENYWGRNPQASDQEVATYLANYFDEGSTVFRAESTHTMNIFFMERGAGASNLHMRFNLASVKPGTVLLSKELADVDASESILAEFPYQVIYRDSNGVERLLTNDPTPDAASSVLYKDSITSVTYKASLTVDGLTYSNVFMLKPGETAEITLPEDAIDYKIIECAVHQHVYNEVEVNGGNEAVTPTTHGHEHRKDYAIGYKRTNERSRVTFTNHVKHNALETMQITKNLFKEDGETPITYEEDQTAFKFRLYLGTEYDDSLTLANMHTYHVKDPQGYYCRWDANQKKFLVIGEGITNYDAMTDEQKASARFTTSMNGTIDRIPTGYTVELREVLANTRFRVVERPWEIPDGYSFQKYKYGNLTLNNATAGVSGTVDVREGPSSGDPYAQENPHVVVCNLKGFGLRVNKVWTDADYMAERDATYFAVFTDDGHGNLTLVSDPNTVRKLAYDASPQTLYWYFPTLPASGVSFDKYEIREVTLTGSNLSIDEEGYVTGYESVTPIGEDGSVTLNGKQKGESNATLHTYTVNYDKGSIETGSNVRVDTVTNDRHGIVIDKTEWDGTTALPNATFELKDATGDFAGTFTSDAQGKVTKAFLRKGVDYTLTETAAPQGYQGMQGPVTLRLESDGTVTVSGGDGEYYSYVSGSGSGLQGDANTLGTLTVKNRCNAFQAIKVDGDTSHPLEGVHFALHRQVTDGTSTNIDVHPMPGYEDLVTNANGIIPGVDNTLPAGTYELREKETPNGYQALTLYTQFTISETGAIALGSHPDEVDITSTTEADSGSPDYGTITYVLTTKNTPLREVSFKKVDIANLERVLAGAKFDLYKLNEYDARPEQPLLSDLVSNGNGLLADGTGATVFALETGKYHLVETEPPGGYDPKEDPVVITVSADPNNPVTYDEGTSVSLSDNGISFADGVYVLTITNAAGFTLPNTGGSGTLPFSIVGVLLVLASALLFVRSRVCAR